MNTTTAKKNGNGPLTKWLFTALKWRKLNSFVFEGLAKGRGETRGRNRSTVDRPRQPSSDWSMPTANQRLHHHHHHLILLLFLDLEGRAKGNDQVRRNPLSLSEVLSVFRKEK